MISIGDFARLGQVSVRMLHHYDRIGLLTPAGVDPHSGYRRYAAAQLARLNRIVALKELGFTVEQVRSALDSHLDSGELRGMLRLRRVELAQEEALTRTRLAGVEHRLQLIEKEKIVNTTEYVVKPLPAVRLAAHRGRVQSQPEIAGFVGPTFAALAEAVSEVGGSLDEPVATYEGSEDGMHVVVGYRHSGPPVDGAETVDLPEHSDAVCAVHLGSMDGIGGAWQDVVRWIESQGYAPSGPGRERYLRADPELDQSEWVTELQQPVVRA